MAVIENRKEWSPVSQGRVLGGEARWRGGWARAGRALEAVVRSLEQKDDLLGLHPKLTGFSLCGGWTTEGQG